MSLTQQIAARWEGATPRARLVRAMERVPYAVGLAVAHDESAARGILVIDATGPVFVRAEQVAMDRLAALRTYFDELVVDLVCVPASEADALDVPPEIEVYRYGTPT
jgi:hypothetical protein